jgi:O-antigen/teichoic acid export membrane protein
MRNITDVNYQRYALGFCIGIAQILMSIRTPYVLLVQAAGHYKQVKIGAFLEAGINIVLTWVLVVKFGIIGAIIGTIVANAFRTVQYGWYASKHMIDRSFMEIVRRFVWMTICLLLSITTSQIVIKYIPVSGWGTWIIDAVIVFGIHCAILLLGSLLFYKQDMVGCLRMAKRLVR